MRELIIIRILIIGMSKLNFKPVKKIELACYMPEQKAYCLDCRVDGTKKSTLVFIPECFFLPASMQPAFKEEEEMENESGT